MLLSKKIQWIYNKKDIINSFLHLFEVSRDIPLWLLSYNDRSYPDLDTMLTLLYQYKKVKIIKKVYENNVGGKGSVAGSSELLFVCY